MSINFSDLSKGMVIELDDQPWQIMDYERHKMQQRAPVTRIKMKNLLSGAVVERTFQRYDTSFSMADIENRRTQYMYTDGDYYHFLDEETFDQYERNTVSLRAMLTRAYPLPSRASVASQAMYPRSIARSISFRVTFSKPRYCRKEPMSFR